LVVLEVFARLEAVVASFEDFVVLRAGLSEALEVARRRVWRDSTVASEQVVVDRTASLTDSVIELAGRTVTAMSRRRAVQEDLQLLIRTN
jgi:hypothetical protein